MSFRALGSFPIRFGQASCRIIASRRCDRRPPHLHQPLSPPPRHSRACRRTEGRLCPANTRRSKVATGARDPSPQKVGPAANYLSISQARLLRAVAHHPPPDFAHHAPLGLSALSTASPRRDRPAEGRAAFGGHLPPGRMRGTGKTDAGNSKLRFHKKPAVRFDRRSHAAFPTSPTPRTPATPCPAVPSSPS